MTGRDALLWHLEQPDSPMHTLKILVLDPTRRGRPVTLSEMHAVIESRLGLLSRATQKLVTAPGFGGIPFWVSDGDFQLSRHLDERHLPAPGTMGQLDSLCSELAMSALPKDRPLWSLTLVHGLEGGRQAIVARVHHAIADGLAALNIFLAATAEQPGCALPPVPAAPAEAVRTWRLWLSGSARAVRLLAGLPGLAAAGLNGYRRTSKFRAGEPDLPPFLGSKRNLFNAPSGARRICATGSLPLDQVKEVAKASGVTVNGALHGILAGAIRTEMLSRGHRADRPAAAAFAIAEDARDHTRLHGNHISPTNVSVFCNLDDPVQRLIRTAGSCRAGVELRRITGVEMAERWSCYGPRFVSLFRRTMANRLPWIVNHVTTANVAGPSSTRWLGDIEVEQWFSFALTLNPANVNLTAHSYAGRINIGLITTPEAMAQPDRFLGFMAAELDTLRRALGLVEEREPALAG